MSQKIKVEDVLGMAPQGDLWLLRVSVYTCAPSCMYMHTDTKRNTFKESYLRGHVLEDALGWGKSLENSRRFRRSILILTLKGSALPSPYVQLKKCWLHFKFSSSHPFLTYNVNGRDLEK